MIKITGRLLGGYSVVKWLISLRSSAMKEGPGTVHTEGGYGLPLQLKNLTNKRSRRLRTFIDPSIRVRVIVRAKYDNIVVH